jgi:hypothetical protein
VSQELLRRANAIRDRNRVLESVPGSGYHDNDKDHLGRFCAPQRRGLPRISDHIVPFYGERDVHFVGPDADRAMAALQKWLESHKTTDAAVFSSYTGTDRKLLTFISNITVSNVDGFPRLVIWKDAWNDLLHALHSHGIGLSGAPLED